MKFAYLTQIFAASAFRDLTEYTFADYKVEFGRSYNGPESGKREALFGAELEKILEQNNDYLSGKSMWWATVNEFSDWTADEFATMKGKSPVPSAEATVKLGKTNNPTRKDWREENVVSKVKNQGSCGSCWAFAATECVESHYMIAEKEDIVLAPQYYVNCVQNPKSCGGTGGCEGAIAELAFNLTAKVGIPLEKDLPYRGRDQTCGSYPAAAICDGYHHLAPNDPD